MKAMDFTPGDRVVIERSGYARFVRVGQHDHARLDPILLEVDDRAPDVLLSDGDASRSLVHVRESGPRDLLPVERVDVGAGRDHNPRALVDHTVVLPCVELPEQLHDRSGDEAPQGTRGDHDAIDEGGAISSESQRLEVGYETCRERFGHAQQVDAAPRVPCLMQTRADEVALPLLA